MKELSIEEKSKRYDELKVKAQGLEHDGCFDKITLFDLFPELEESEDESIRKELIQFFSDKDEEDYEGMHPRAQIIAWLEKQGEKISRVEIEPTPIFGIGDVLKRKGKDYTFRVDRIQGGYYHCDRNHGAYFPIEQQDDWELVEQKPAAWSEEDETTKNNICHIIRQYDKISKKENQPCWYVGDCLLWMQNIKDRVIPQPKQECSDEDERIRHETIELLETANHPNVLHRNGKALDFTEILIG